MGLLSVNIKANRKLSLIEVDIPAKKIEAPVKDIKKEKLSTPITEAPPTTEDIAYSRFIILNPLTEELVDRLNLVSTQTGKKPRIVGIPAKYKPSIDTEPKTHTANKEKLLALALRILKGERTYTKEDIVGLIINDMKVNQDRAEKGFNLLLQSGAIQPVGWGRYYLTGSTPF